MNIGTILFTWLNGELVGEDEFGTRYYRSKSKKRWGREQRWCLFKGSREASRVPPEWHGWLHHTVAQPLTQMSIEPLIWQKPHEPNLTGTTDAYRPRGHAYRGGKRSTATGDYEAWVPE